jgi:hypothetical protein
LRRGFCALLSQGARKSSIESSVGARSWSIEISGQTQSYPGGGRAGSAELVVPVAFAGLLVSRYHISIEQEPNLRADCYMWPQKKRVRVAPGRRDIENFDL